MHPDAFVAKELPIQFLNMSGCCSNGWSDVASADDLNTERW
jgi:hypothetical protein